MDHCNGRFIILILKIRKESPKLPHQKHSFIHNGPAAHGHHIGIIIALFKFPTGNIKPPVKTDSGFHILGFPYKCLHDTGHTFSCLTSQNLRKYRNRPPAQKLQIFLFKNNLKHFFRLCTADLMLRKKQLGNSIFPFSANIKSLFFAYFFKKFMGNLQKDPYSVTSLAFCILSCTMFQMLYNPQGIGNCFMCFFAFNIYYCTDTAVIMFKLPAIKPLLFFLSHFFHNPHPPVSLIRYPHFLPVCTGRLHKSPEKRMRMIWS